MCGEIISRPIGDLSSKLIDKILTQKEPALIEVKSVYINGIDETIKFFIHVKKSTHKGKKFLQKINDLLGIKNLIPFYKDFEIRVINNLNQQDITNEVVKQEGALKNIDLNVLVGMQGNTFVIEVRGPYSLRLHDIYDCSLNHTPIWNDDKKRVYDIKILVFHHSFACEEIFFTDLPIILPFAIEFISERLLTTRQLKLYRTIESHLHERGKYERYRRSLTQQLGFEPEELYQAYGRFLAVLEARVRRRFREFLSLESQNQRAYFSKCVVEYPRIGRGLPHIELHPTICFDYNNDTEKIIHLKLTINKEKLIQIADKIWSKIKRPKRTAPKKTLR